MAFFIDVGPLWLAAIPLMALTSLVLDAPVFLRRRGRKAEAHHRGQTVDAPHQGVGRQHVLTGGHVGKFGAPALGVTGAAVATLTSRIVEFAVAVGYALWCKRLPLQWGCLLRPGRAILRNFRKNTGSNRSSTAMTTAPTRPEAHSRVRLTCKFPLGLVRFHSRRWINDITREGAQE